MLTHVIITGQFPPMLVATATDEGTAAACADHLRAMFPHIRENVETVESDNWQVLDSCPVSGFPRDCVQAYINTGNGAARPTPGTLRLTKRES